MATLSLLRALTLGFVLVAQGVLPQMTFISILIALTFSHYAVSLYFAGPRIRQGFSGRGLAIGVLMVAIVVCAFLDAPPMILLFGFHHVCNEVFLHERRMSGVSVPVFLRRSRFFLETMIYFGLVASDFRFYGWPDATPFLAWGLAIGTGLLVVGWWKAQRTQTVASQVLISEFFFTGGGVLAASYCLSRGAGGLDVALFYHFSFWALAPLAKLQANGGTKALAVYAVTTLASVFVTLPLTPLAGHWGQLSMDTLSRWTRVGGYFHILSSLALSTAHPMWIRNWFEPKVMSANSVFKKVA